MSSSFYFPFDDLITYDGLTTIMSILRQKYNVELKFDRSHIPILDVSNPLTQDRVCALKLACRFCGKATSRNKHSNKKLILARGYFCRSCIGSDSYLKILIAENKNLEPSKCTMIDCRDEDCAICNSSLRPKAPERKVTITANFLAVGSYGDRTLTTPFVLSDDESEDDELSWESELEPEDEENSYDSTLVELSAEPRESRKRKRNFDFEEEKKEESLSEELSDELSSLSSLSDLDRNEPSPIVVEKSKPRESARLFFMEV